MEYRMAAVIAMPITLCVADCFLLACVHIIMTLSLISYVYYWSLNARWDYAVSFLFSNDICLDDCFKNEIYLISMHYIASYRPTLYPAALDIYCKQEWITKEFIIHSCCKLYSYSATVSIFWIYTMFTASKAPIESGFRIYKYLKLLALKCYE